MSLHRAFLEMKIAKHKKRIEDVNAFIYRHTNAMLNGAPMQQEYYSRFNTVEHKQEADKNEEELIQAKHKINYQLRK